MCNETCFPPGVMDTPTPHSTWPCDTPPPSHTQFPVMICEICNGYLETCVMNIFALVERAFCNWLCLWLRMVILDLALYDRDLLAHFSRHFWMSFLIHVGCQMCSFSWSKLRGVWLLLLCKLVWWVLPFLDCMFLPFLYRRVCFC